MKRTLIGRVRFLHDAEFPQIISSLKLETEQVFEKMDFWKIIFPKKAQSRAG